MAAPSMVKETMFSPEFPRFFDAQHADFHEDLPLWFALAAEARGPILELGCGPGRVLAALATSGHSVEGLDRDPQMLSRAARRLAHHSVRLHCGDLRSFNLESRYTLILLPCNTFAQLDDADAAAMLACARRHLLRRGRLAAELPTPSESHGLPAASDGPLAAFIEPESGNPVQLYAESTPSPDGRVVEVKWHYDELQPEGLVRRTTVQTTFYLRRPSEVRRLLRAAGFASTRFLGDYDGSRYRRGAPRLILLAQTP